MAAKKYQVFVSSTFRDLIDERQDTIRNILDLNHIPAGMELFPAADVEQLAYIKKVIDECDYYLLIIGGRYGSLDAEGISFTEREYDYAVETGRFVIAFVHAEPGAISVQNSDVKPELAAALNAFRGKVMKGRLVREWTNRQDLQLAVLKSLLHAFTAYPQVGWIRGDTAADRETLEQVNSVHQENAKLRSELERAKAAPLEKLENLADLDDEVEVRYTYRVSARGRSTYRTTKETFTWRQIFIPLAGLMTVSRTERVINEALKLAANEKGLATPSAINQLDLATIKVQFLMSDLISARTSRTTEGVPAEFLDLTDKGKRIFLTGKVVRKDS
ncbi:DUF4062 domain-containing protein [Shinella sp. M31]|uniref:DUF4062 domain-containing protein n=1 Tax=Shinella sp. M31 TaxID=3368615 RepID=UPI003BA0DE80